MGRRKKAGADPRANSAEDEPLELSLEDTAAQRQRGVSVPGRRTSTGYNPYDAPLAPDAGRERPRRRTDLRKLSAWMRLRRDVDALKEDETVGRSGSVDFRRALLRKPLPADAPKKNKQ